MTRWSAERVRGLAPDEGSLRSARALAQPGPWSDTGATEGLVWGKCQGSGKQPYQVSVDLEAPAYRCSCPSRKFPCKHGLALLLLWSESDDIAQVCDPEAIAQAEEAYRAKARARAAARTAEPAKPVDPEAQERRRTARLEAMDAGIEDFGRWLQDLVRSGTAAARGREPDWIENAAARLVDAQCPGLAAEVRDLPRVLHGGPDWAERTPALLGRWWTVVQAWQRRDHLTEDQLADVRAVLGWPWSKEEIRSRPVVNDHWLILGVRRMEQERLVEQRTWFHGVNSHEIAVGLEFAAGGQPLPVPQAVGAVLSSPASFYPGSAPRRLLFTQDPVPVDPCDHPQGTDITPALGTMARQRAVNPLSEVTPVVLEDVRLTADRVVDATGASLPVAGRPSWAALAVGGGRPGRCFGELSPAGFTPLTLIVAGEVVPCD